MARQYYFRNFISLSEKNSEYTNPGRKAQGRCILESRGKAGKISLYVQDLKPEPNYGLYLFSVDRDKSQGVYISPVYMNENGKADYKIDADADDIMTSGLSIENINAVVLAAPGSDKNSINALLEGYTDNEALNWRKNLSFQKEMKNEIKEEIKEEIKLEIKEIPKVENENDINIIVVENPNPHEVFKEQAIKFNEELKNLEYIKFEYPNEIEIKDITAEDIFLSNTKMSPFEPENPNILWVRTAPSELCAFPFDHEKYADHPFVLNGYNNYKHLIAGKFIYEDGKKYIIGVPDVFNCDNKQTASELGFKQFKSCGGRIKDGEYGYWLMII